MSKVCKMCHGSGYDEGGDVEESLEHGGDGYPDQAGIEREENEYGHEDFAGRVMKARNYSKGGMVANKTFPESEGKENDFDDLALRDDLESSYTDANSGDEVGDAQEDKDRDDIISRVMRSRRKTPGRNPVPA